MNTRFFLFASLPLLGPTLLWTASALEGEKEAGESLPFVIDVEAGATVLVDLSSEDFDPKLFARLPDGSLLSNDDFNGYNSRLEIDSGEGGLIELVVGSFSEDGSGSFNLEANLVSEGKAVEVRELEGDEIPALPGEEFGVLAVYELVDVPEGSGVAVLLEGEEIDPYLIVRLADGSILTADDHGDSWNALLQLNAGQVEGSVFYATVFGGDVSGVVEGAWTIGASATEVEPVEPTKGEFDPAELMPEEGESGDIIGPAVLEVYRVPVGPEAAVTVRLSSEAIDSLLVAQLPGGEIVHNDDMASDNLNSELELTSEEEGEAVVLACSLNGNQGEFEFSADGAEAVQSNEDPTAIMDAFLNPPVPEREWDSTWYFGDTPAFVELEGQPMPELPLDSLEWRGEPLAASDLEGKVVILDFWTTWCGPCVAAIPHNQELSQEHADELVVLGICLENDAAEMDTILSDNNADYPAAFASEEVRTQLQDHYTIEFFPTYVVIDREGIVRANGLSPAHLDAVVADLLAEE